MAAHKKIIISLVILFVFVMCAWSDEIHDAAREDDLAKVKALLDKDPKLINTKDENGRTPMHWAARGVHKEMIALLIEKGADVNALDNYKITALSSVAYRGHKEAAELLIKKGADINLKDDDGWTALHCAAYSGHKDMAELLIANGAEMDKKNGEGITPLHSAALRGFKEIVKYLITKGAKINVKDKNGNTPLHSAAGSGHEDMVVLLIEKGADINAKDNCGNTPLYWAAEFGQKMVVDYLIKNGAVKSQKKFPILQGEYLGQKKPGLTPELFAPGIVSTKDCSDFSSTFSPDGKEFYFTRRKEGIIRNRLMYMKMVNGIWTAPQLAPFAYNCFEFEPHISPDGKKLFYGSRRPLPGKTELNRYADIWIVDKTETGWLEPYPLKLPVKEEFVMMYVTSSNNGTIYYTEPREEKRSIYRSRLIDGQYTKPEKLGDAINSPTPGAHPFIAPDESYIIFDTWGRTDGQGSTDLYISFRKKDGTWAKAKNMGDKINSENEDLAAFVTRDGKFLFYSVFINGNAEIYWVDAKIIDKLRDE